MLMHIIHEHTLELDIAPFGTWRAAATSRAPRDVTELQTWFATYARELYRTPPDTWREVDHIRATDRANLAVYGAVYPIDEHDVRRLLAAAMGV